MKKNLFLIIVAIILAVAPVSAQSKVALTDKVQLLTGETETQLKDRLQADSYELTSMIDTRKRCDYWFFTLSMKGDDLIMSVTDCNDKAAGSKNMGSKILTATDSEKALLLYFALSDILKNPYKDTAIPLPETVKVVSTVPVDTLADQTDPGQHKTRYFFSPSSYNLEKGELYYNSLYFFVHDLQYGISNQFSIGMGTTIMGFPFYITPKVTIPINDQSAVAIGDMLIIGTWGTKFSGNLLYTTYTMGNSYNNLTFGGGYLHLGDGEITNKTNSLVFNLAALLQVSDHIFFITENYTSSVNTKQSAYYNEYDPVTFEGRYYSENYEQKMLFFYGMAGFRFINRNKDVRSWQIGLSYIFRAYGEVPLKYRGTNWYTDAVYNESKFIAFPVIGYARKFSAKY